MAQGSKFSINVSPMYVDEWRASGVVDLLTYYVWDREAQVEYLRHLGLKDPPNSRAAPVRMEAVYTTPLLMTEEAKVYYRTTKMGRSSTTSEAQLNEATSGRAVATITTVTVWVDTQTGRTIPITDENKQKIIDFEGKENVEVG